MKKRKGNKHRKDMRKKLKETKQIPHRFYDDVMPEYDLILEGLKC